MTRPQTIKTSKECVQERPGERCDQHAGGYADSVRQQRREMVCSTLGVIRQK